MEGREKAGRYYFAMGGVASALWQAPHLSAGDRLLNYVFSWLLPMASIPNKISALEKSRKLIANISGSGFKHEMAMWEVTDLDFPRADGSMLRVVLCSCRRSAGKAPLVVWYHGGAYTTGSEMDSSGAALWKAVINKADQHEVVFASVQYRVAPEHKAPAAAEDCERAVRFLLNSDDLGAKHGYDRTRVHLWGQSAGAALALVVAASLCRAGDSSNVASVLADSPMCHPPCDTASFVQFARVGWLAPAAWLRWAWKAYLQAETAEELAAALRDPLVCPHAAPGGLDGVRGVSVVVATGRADTLHDEGVRAAKAWRSAGASVSHVELNASHCLGAVFDKAGWEVVTTALAGLLRGGALVLADRH